MHYALDQKTQKFISFELSSDEHFFDIAEVRAESRGKSSRYVCIECRSPVSLVANPLKIEESAKYFFRHHPNTGQGCSLHTETGKNRSGIHNGIQEGRKHRETKFLIASLLSHLPNWSVVDVDRKMVISDDGLNRRKPDVHAQFHETDVAIEVQFHTENPLVLQERQAFYRDKGWYLIFISLDSIDSESREKPQYNLDEIPSSLFEETFSPTRQVHKDIAALQAGNWFIFSKENIKQAMKEKKWFLTAQFLNSTCDKNGELATSWREAIVSFDELRKEAGKTYYFDSSEQQKRAKESCKKIQLQFGHAHSVGLLKDCKYRNYAQYKNDLKSNWAGFSEFFEHDEPYHFESFNKNFSIRSQALARKVIQFGKQYFSDNHDHQKFYSMQERLTDLPFGLGKHDLVATANLICVLGIPLYDGNITPQGVATSAAARILDAHHEKPLFTAQHALLKAIELSSIPGLIKTKALQKRYEAINEIEHRQKSRLANDYITFVEWFTYIRN